MPDSSDSLVLIVDDTPDHAEILGRMLKTAGYRSAMVQDGFGALAFVEQERPDLILLDITMPQMSGIEVCRRLKSNDATKSIPVIFITAMAKTELKVQGFEAGGVDYVTKPFSVPEVLARAKTHLTNAHLTKQLRRSNAELRELNQLKSRLLGLAAHDLRSPLAAICGFASLLRDEQLLGPLAEQQRQLVELIINGGQGMLDLIDNLLDVTAIEAGKLDLRLRAGPLQPLIEERMRLAELVARSKGVRLRQDFAAVDNVVHDADRIAQVVDSLLSYAVKLSPADKTVTVSLAPEAGLARIDVSTEGPGIAPEEQSPLSGELERLSTQLTGEERGTGLALSIAKRIAEAHGGELRAASGSTLSLLLPLAGPAPEAGSKPRAAG